MKPWEVERMAQDMGKKLHDDLTKALMNHMDICQIGGLPASITVAVQLAVLAGIQDSITSISSNPEGLKREMERAILQAKQVIAKRKQA